MPKKEVSLPQRSYKAVYPFPPILEKPESPHRPITERFSQRDLTEISTTDPLLSSEQSIILDLGAIQEDDFAYPLPGSKVISPYAGRRRHHSGIDIKTRANDTIRCAFDGIVRLAKPYHAYGNVIVVRHYNGLETIYSHNSKNLVKPNERVKAGQAIALTGRTGRATTEHLHFETRFNGQHFNPNLIFDLQKRTLHRYCLQITKHKNGYDIKPIYLFPHQRSGDYQYPIPIAK